MTRFVIRNGRICWTFLLCLLLVGCGKTDSPDAFFTRLTERLSNVTGVPVPSRALEPALPSYPRPRDLIAPIDDVRVGVATYLGLGRCGLLAEISARNSSLGKFQSASGRLLYEKRLLRQLERCRESQKIADPGDLEGLHELTSLIDRKTSNLPAVFWNATFASPEFRVLLSTATDPLPMHAPSLSSGLVGALRVLIGQGRALEPEEMPIESSRLESQYALLQSSKQVGPLLQGMRVSRDYLERGSAMLERAAQEKTLCPLGKRTARADPLFNVFQTFYIGEAQPYLSLIHTQSRALIEAFHDLVAAEQHPIPEAFRSFYDQTLNPLAAASLWVLFDQSLSRHTRAWQSVLRHCDLLPDPERLKPKV